MEKQFHSYEDFTELWGLRILLQLEGWKTLGSNQKHYISTSSEGLDAVGLGHLIDGEITIKDLRSILKKKQAVIEKRELTLDPTLSNNLTLLAQEIGFNHTERQLLLFTLIHSVDKNLKKATGCLEELSSESIISAVSIILDEEVNDVRKALSPTGMLAKTGILKLGRDYVGEISDRFELFDGFPILFEPHENISSFLHKFAHLATDSELTSEDFSHLHDEFKITSRYLKTALSSHAPGVNILFYGPPGTGKTELAKTIANDINCEMYEVVATNSHDESMGANRRISAFQIAQHILARKGERLILFDEIEEVIEDNSSNLFLITFVGQPTKSAINELLENNPVPTIWIANDVDQVDSAVLRRFDIVLHIDYPPLKTRSRILNKYLHDLPLEKEWIECIADNKTISPGLISRASKVVRSINCSNTKNDLELLIGNTLRAMGNAKPINTRTTHKLPYNLDAVNADTDLTLLVNGLVRHPEARLCLYGPPGTGKTEFGHYVARFVDKQLLAKRASDILNPFVGGTEANIAQMFSEAIREDAVLLLDEADSFLQDRKNAHRSWEVTQVNELLTQMEAFGGIFICSTNIMGSLDEASLRRFDLKIKFDYLKPDQAWVLFKQLLDSFKIRLKNISSWKKEISEYTNLTPGDFATVSRQIRLGSLELNPDDLLASLAKESRFKKDTGALNIGFTARI